MTASLAISRSLLPSHGPRARRGRGGSIHFEIQRTKINKVVDASIPILGDVTENFETLTYSDQVLGTRFVVLITSVGGRRSIRSST